MGRGRIALAIRVRGLTRHRGGDYNPEKPPETPHGNPPRGLAPDTSRAEGIFHRHRVAGADHRIAGTRARGFQPRLLRAVRAVSGFGRVQSKGGPVKEIRPGDTVWIAPGEVHWHGASPTTGMVHITVQEAADGKYADWMEKVTDEEYGK